MNQNVSPIVTCVLCKQQTCAVHRVKWHKGMTCNEYDQQQAVPVITVKQCPKCQSNIENNLGSDRVICSKCKYEYCWECMADYKQIQKKGPLITRLRAAIMRKSETANIQVKCLYDIVNNRHDGKYILNRTYFLYFLMKRHINLFVALKKKKQMILTQLIR